MDKIVTLNAQECQELSKWFADQTDVEIETGYRELIFRRQSAIELRMALQSPSDDKPKVDTIKQVRAVAVDA